jgi:hypothetical protein
MRCALRAFSVVLCAAALYAQSAASNEPAPGLETAWEIAPTIQELAAHAGRLVPILDKLQIRAWVEKGASDTYLAQRDSAKEQAVGLATEAKALAANPERLSAALQVLFRLQAVETMAGSLIDGARRYQTPQDAQALATAVAQGGAGRERLQRYVVNLAAQREQDLAVMNAEAQRCRGILTQQTPAKTTRKK